METIKLSCLRQEAISCLSCCYGSTFLSNKGPRRPDSWALIHPLETWYPFGSTAGREAAPRDGGGSLSCNLVPEGTSKAVPPFSRWGWARLDLSAFLPTQDEKYWSRRYKNNEAAKRSRDARRLKENQISVRAAFLEKENALLRQEVVAVRQELSHYRAVLSRYQAQHGAL